MFVCLSERNGDTLRMALTGELVLETTHVMQQEIEAINWNFRRLILDCSQLEFLDSTGVSALLFLVRRCEEQGVGLEVANIQEDIRDALDVMGFFDLLPRR